VISEGKLEVLGRADRVLISGGIKVSLERVEQAALNIPGVDQVVAVPISSEWGESVGLLYQGSPEANFESLAQQVSIAAKPAKTLRVNSFPMTSTGKVDLLESAKLLSD
jgi:O-succinylbenzoic acid--CoA ligase